MYSIRFSKQTSWVWRQRQIFIEIIEHVCKLWKCMKEDSVSRVFWEIIWTSLYFWFNLIWKDKHSVWQISYVSFKKINNCMFYRSLYKKWDWFIIRAKKRNHTLQRLNSVWKKMFASKYVYWEIMSNQIAHLYCNMKVTYIICTGLT